MSHTFTNTDLDVGFVHFMSQVLVIHNSLADEYEVSFSLEIVTKGNTRMVMILTVF